MIFIAFIGQPSASFHASRNHIRLLTSPLTCAAAPFALPAISLAFPLTCPDTFPSKPAISLRACPIVACAVFSTSCVLGTSGFAELLACLTCCVRSAVHVSTCQKHKFVFASVFVNGYRFGSQRASGHEPVLSIPATIVSETLRSTAFKVAFTLSVTASVTLF